jgi:hypothetical protein
MRGRGVRPGEFWMWRSSDLADQRRWSQETHITAASQHKTSNHVGTTIPPHHGDTGHAGGPHAVNAGRALSSRCRCCGTLLMQGAEHTKFVMAAGRWCALGGPQVRAARAERVAFKSGVQPCGTGVHCIKAVYACIAVPQDVLLQVRPAAPDRAPAADRGANGRRQSGALQLRR